MSAVTDTGGDENMSPGIENLFTLLQCFAHDALYNKFKKRFDEGNLHYQELKENLAEHIIETLAPIQERRTHWEQNTDMLAEILIDGTQKAHAIAQKTLVEVKEKTGLK